MPNDTAYTACFKILHNDFFEVHKVQNSMQTKNKFLTMQTHQYTNHHT